MTTSDDKLSNKYIIKTSRENIYQSMLKGCCSSYCVDYFKVKDVMTGRILFHSMSEQQKSSYLLKYLSSVVDDDIKDNMYYLTLKERNVCVRAFCCFYGCSLSKYYYVFDKVKLGSTVIIHGNQYRHYDDKKRASIISYFEVRLF